MELAEFLLARIAEDEAVARGALDHPVPSDADITYVTWQRYDTGWVPATRGEWVDGSAMIRHFHPGRVLAECAAKRRIVEQSHVLSRSGPGRVVDFELRWVLETLALPYADHPDYRKARRP